MEELNVDPINLGEQGRWTELASLGRDAWNRWADNESEKLEGKRSPISFEGQTIEHKDFSGFRFPVEAVFCRCTFKQSVSFSDAKFFSTVNFSNAVFEKDAVFSGSEFNGDALYQYVKFRGDASFENTMYRKTADFERVTYKGGASFERAAFSGNAHFVVCEFEGVSDFNLANFDSMTNFDRTVFIRPPVMVTTNFKYTPSLVDTKFYYFESGDARELYRRIKRYAADAYDHDTEYMLFALEMKSKRILLSWLVPWHWHLLVLNYLYGWFSIYGQSVGRPLVVLIGIYYWGAYKFAGLIEMQDSSLALWPDSVWIASSLSLMPFVGQTMIGRDLVERTLCPIEDDYACMSELYRISVIEGFLGLIFFFLLGLALRNLFRIK